MTQMDVNAWNRQVIEQFRANGGKVGGQFENMHLLLLHTIGSKTGQERINPLAYMSVEDRMLIVASKGGAPTNPTWYYNLLAHPDVTVEIGTETFTAQAIVVKEEERDRLYEKLVSQQPGFGEYQKQTERKIPVVELIRS